MESATIQAQWGIAIETIEELRTGKQYIAKVTDSAKKTYYLKGEICNPYDVEKTIHFAHALQTQLPVTTYVPQADHTYAYYDGHYTYTLEEAMYGEDVTQLNDEKIIEIGRMLAIMHQFSEQHALRLYRATSWSMFGGNQTDEIGDYDENEQSFWQFRDAFDNEPLFVEIEKLYNEHRQQLKQLWPQLPIGATQGDFCHYNMLFSNNKIDALYDFNLAGDEVFINECIAVGVYVCWHVEYSGIKSGADRFARFLQAYTSVRQWTQLEQQAFPHLFAIIRAFRYDRVADGIQRSATADFVKETYELLLMS